MVILARVHRFSTLSGKVRLQMKLGARAAPLGGGLKPGFQLAAAIHKHLENHIPCIYRQFGLGCFFGYETTEKKDKS